MYGQKYVEKQFHLRRVKQQFVAKMLANSCDYKNLDLKSFEIAPNPSLGPSVDDVQKPAPKYTLTF